MQRVGGDYADPTMRLVLIPTDTPTEDTMHALEGGVEALMEGGAQLLKMEKLCISISADGSCFESCIDLDQETDSNVHNGHSRELPAPGKLSTFQQNSSLTSII